MFIPAVAATVETSFQTMRRDILFWLLVSAITVGLISSYGGYHAAPLRRFVQSADLALRCYLATSLAMLCMALLLGHDHAVSHYWTTAELGATPVLLISLRKLVLFTSVHKRAAMAACGPVVVCYDQAPGDLTKALMAQHIYAAPAAIYYLSGALADAGGMMAEHATRLVDVPALLSFVADRQVADIIFIYQPELELVSGAGRKQLLSDLLAFPARIWLAFNTEPEMPHPLASRAGHYRLVPVVSDSLVSSINLPKRLFDLTAGFALLLAALPLLAAIALAVRLSGPGPVVFRQTRTGAQGQSFTVMKFRTMRHQAGAAFTQASRNDPRVTRIGQFLRRTSLDELLQLVNVLQGDMSLVGPRPHAPETQVQGVTFEEAVKFYRLRHRVKPGMTGLAQIRGQRGETPAINCLEQRLSSDLEYIETWSVWLDIMIMLQTLPTMFTQKNAF